MIREAGAGLGLRQQQMLRNKDQHRSYRLRRIVHCHVLQVAPYWLLQLIFHWQKYWKVELGGPEERQQKHFALIVLRH